MAALSLCCAALAVCAPPPAALAAPPPSVLGHVRRLLMSGGEVRHFRGSLMGVTARVALDVASRRADLELSGAALGGRLRGSGTLAGEANHGRVVLDDELQCSLSLRFVSVRSAVYDPDAGTVTVCVKVPIFGERDILLREEHQHTRL